MKKLGLGTVQFGLDYGVTNAHGQTPPSEAGKIVDAAIRAGVLTFDTAAAYGSSEEVLGAALPSHAAVRIVTKIPGMSGERIDDADVERCRLLLEQSLRRLRRDSLYGVLLHRADDLRKPGSERIVSYLESMKRAGRVHRIGVSAYDPAQICMALDRMPVDLVQLPLNLLDQRALRNDTLELAHRRGIEVHARSIFLQGVLLSDPDRLPNHFQTYRHQLEAVGRVAADAGVSRLTLCLRFALEQPHVDCAIVGVTTFSEWQEMVVASGQNAPLPTTLAGLASDEQSLINPSLWPARS